MHPGVRPRTRVTAALALVAVSGLAGSAMAGGKATGTVSLVVARAPNPATPGWGFLHRFSGTISTGAAGEDVTVLQQVCGYPAPGTAVAGTQTRAGGAWDVEPVDQSQIALSATFRARWRNETSTPVTLRARMPVFLIPIGRGRLLFRASLGGVYQNMLGRTVLLERLRGTRWVVVQTRKLRAEGGPSGAYVTRFEVRRGWTVRARLSRKVAAPCFAANTSAKVRVI
jgi:hypothetical protein